MGLSPQPESVQPVTKQMVLDSIHLEPGSDDTQVTKVFFMPGIAERDIAVDDPGGALEFKSIGGAGVATLQITASSRAALRLGGDILGQPATKSECELFAGLNCAVSERNGETAGTLCDWLQWHQRWHGLQGAVIVDRSPPEEADRFAAELEQEIALTDGLDDPLTIVVLAADKPLGKPEIGPEMHPMNAPDAPGKDRMDAPSPEPWSAPLGVLNLYELVRQRFLSNARAVMNIDVYDLVPAPEEKAETVFDKAVAAPQGLVVLAGERVYPWALRKGRKARFSDHICSRFDGPKRHRRWVVAPSAAPKSVVWRLVRIAGADPAAEVIPFYRCMALRYRADGEDEGKISRIVPKSSLIENGELLNMAKFWTGKPVRMPKENTETQHQNSDRVAIVTTMKNEGPFILEWLAYHRAIGVDDFLVYTNDCDDGTDTMLAMLQEKGIVQHRDNRFRDTGLKPQHAALASAEKEPLIQNAGWAICMDVDEFITVHTGDGTLKALFEAVPDANMISLTWRLFGNADVEEFRDELITEQFTHCAPLMTRKPHQAWGFKTLFRNIGLFKKLGVHRPKGLKPQLVDQINWVNGSGVNMPKEEYRNAWRSTVQTVGYDLVTLNHYALRSAESFLVKRDRGRVNHVDRDQGMAYWFRMNNNAERDRSIYRMLPALQIELDRLLADPDIAAAHAYSVSRHRTRIDELKKAPKYTDFYEELIGERLQRLSRLHAHFGSSVFLAGPECIPDTVLSDDIASDYFFSVPKTKTQH
nr:glycosyltransferase family 2 protein [Zongyanglinia huanghaiensis]